MAQQKETADKPEKTEKKAKKEKKETEVASPVAEAPPVAPKPATKSMKIGKLAPKNKSRLPRRLKKAQKKAAGRL